MVTPVFLALLASAPSLSAELRWSPPHAPTRVVVAGTEDAFLAVWEGSGRVRAARFFPDGGVAPEGIRDVRPAGAMWSRDVAVASRPGGFVAVYIEEIDLLEVIPSVRFLDATGATLSSSDIGQPQGDYSGSLVASDDAGNVLGVLGSSTGDEAYLLTSSGGMPSTLPTEPTARWLSVAAGVGQLYAVTQSIAGLTVRTAPGDASSTAWRPSGSGAPEADLAVTESGVLVATFSAGDCEAYVLDHSLASRSGGGVLATGSCHMARAAEAQGGLACWRTTGAEIRCTQVQADGSPTDPAGWLIASGTGPEFDVAGGPAQTFAVVWAQPDAGTANARVLTFGAPPSGDGGTDGGALADGGSTPADGGSAATDGGGGAGLDGGSSDGGVLAAAEVRVLRVGCSAGPEDAASGGLGLFWGLGAALVALRRWFLT